ncbi:coiled-coil domain-containing protein 173-like [Scleropages formosus]|uniref:coiled-coil domain-containing protein 173-like n=1 Tax=Scleropages formosus TaxID=113540 RepID=UPI0008783D11|nr:coiled-coil domain-containing protein 173-like [Scleropages formosus]
MAVASASFSQYRRAAQNGRRITPTKNGVVQETITQIQAPNLHQLTELPKAEWLQLQDSLNHVNKHSESIMDLSKEQEILQHHSKEVAKSWSNTIAGQRQKKLEAKQIREENREKERKQADVEHIRYQQQKRKEAIEKAKTKLLYQTDRVRGFHSALLLSEVLNEWEAQLELKQKMLNASRNVERDVIAALRKKEEEAMQREEHRAKQRRLKNKATAEDLKQQMKEHKYKRNQERLRIKKEAEELLQLQELYNRENNRLEQEEKEQKQRIMNAYKEHMATRDLLKALDAQREDMEEERRRMIITAKEKMMKLRKEKEAERFRGVQRRNEALLESVTELERLRQQEVFNNEQELFSKAVAQREARLAQEQNEKDEKKMAMLGAIALHRETKQQEEEERDRDEKQKDLDILYAAKEADRLFFEEQLLKAQKMKHDRKTLQDAHIHQMAEKRTKKSFEKNREMGFNTKNADLFADEEKWFQIYAQGVINRAAQAGRNIYPLRKAARMGIGGGLGPIIGGMRPSYLVQL